jgi:hypothetical protein
MQDVRNDLESAREKMHDHSLSLLSDAVYRGDTQAKSLERQTAKISRAIEKALHELTVLERMSEIEA